jgi:hypothetical protein
LWQGAPRGLALAGDALHVRAVAIYFALFTLWRIASIAGRDGAASEMLGVAATSLLALFVGGALLLGLGWLMARSTIYTITNRRVVLRYGVAIRKYVNVPFIAIDAVRLKKLSTGAGSVALSTGPERRVPYLHLWPHARPFRFSAPEAMLRAIPDAASVSALLSDAIKANAPATMRVTIVDPECAAPKIGQGAPAVAA